MQVTEYVKKLPDYYKRQPSSNNYKLLDLEARLVSDFREDVEAVHETLDIHKSAGKTLDLYG